MIKNLQLLKQLFIYNFKRELQFKTNFIVSIFVMDILYYGVQVVLFQLIFQHVDAIGSFTKSDMMVFLLTFVLTESTWDLFFGLNLGKLNHYVVSGELDFMLVRPVSSQFFFSFRYLQIPNMVTMGLVALSLIWLIPHYGYSVSPLRLFTYILLCFNGVLIIYLIDFFTNALVFWFRKFTYARWLWYEIIKISHRPDVIYPRFLQKLFFVFPPLIVINSLPTRVLIKDFPLVGLWPVPIISGILFWTSTLVWKRGLMRYESASS